MSCQSTAEQYRELISKLPLHEIEGVQRWSVVVYCDPADQPTMVRLEGVLPGSFFPRKFEIDDKLREWEQSLTWPQLGRPVVDVHTPEDIRNTHSPRCLVLPVEFTSGVPA